MYMQECVCVSAIPALSFAIWTGRRKNVAAIEPRTKIKAAT